MTHCCPIVNICHPDLSPSFAEIILTRGGKLQDLKDYNDLDGLRNL